MLNRFKNIVIGAAPFSENPSDLHRVSQTLKHLKMVEGRNLHVLSMLNPTRLDWPRTFDYESWTGGLRRRAELDLNERCEAAQLAGRVDVKVIERAELSQSKDIRFFLKECENLSADLIVVHTQTKSVNKAFLGSFCYGVLNASQVPVLVLPFSEPPPPTIRKILFTTDFSNLSLDVLRALLETGRFLDAGIVVFHMLSQIAPDLGAKELAKKSNELEDWKKNAVENGCVLEGKLQPFGLNRVTSILNAADDVGADLIVMTSRMSAFEAPTFGITVKQVVRQAKVPVLIVPVPYTPPGQWSEEI